MSEDRAIWQSKTFKSGNSVALRLPKGMGVAEGTAMNIVRESPTTFRLEPVDAPKRKIDVSKFAGKAPWLKELTPEDREFEQSPRPWDDPDWVGWKGRGR